MTKAKAFGVGALAGASVIVVMVVALWVLQHLSGPGPIVLVYLIVLFSISALAGARTGGEVVAAAGIWVGQIICLLAMLLIVMSIYYRVAYTKPPHDAGQGEGILLVFALPFITIVGTLVSLAGIWFGQSRLAK